MVEDGDRDTTTDSPAGSVRNSQKAKSKLDDGERAQIIAASGLIAGVISWLIIKLALAEYLEGPELLNWFYGMGGVVLGSLLVYGFWPDIRGFWITLCKTYNKLMDTRTQKVPAPKTEAEPEQDERNETWFLWTGVFLLFLAVGFLIVLTGGIVRSPFSPYGVVMIAMGLFLAEPPKERPRWFTGWFLASAGIVYYVTLGIITQGGAIQNVKDGNYPDTPKMTLVWCIIVAINILVSVAVTNKTHPPEKP